MHAEYSMTCLAPTVAAILGLPTPAQTTGQPIPAIVDALQPAERIAQLCPDALGTFPFAQCRDEMPFLSGLHDQNSMRLRSVMPTITPVNFATMLTGADKSVHGIGAFTDEMQCETLFDVVRANGGTSAGVGQPGWTGGELLGRYADIWGRADSNDDADVEALAMQIAREKSPQYLIVQVGNTDKIFHQFGPSSPEALPGVREMDERLSRMVPELLALGYRIIINADHGQHDTATGGSHGSDDDMDALVDCTWVQ